MKVLIQVVLAVLIALPLAAVESAPQVPPVAQELEATPLVRVVENRIAGSTYRAFLIDDPLSRVRLGVVLADGQAQILEDQQVVSFLEKAEREGSVDAATLQQLHQTFKGMLTVLAAPHARSERDVQEPYQEIYGRIADAKQQADRMGKELLVVVGEDHLERRSLLWEMMVLDAANRQGIHRLNTETTKELLSRVKATPADEVTSPNFSFALRFAEQLGFEISSSDPRQHAEDPTRNKAMLKALSSAGKDAVFIVGANHLRDICADPVLQKRYELLVLNASEIDDVRRDWLQLTPGYPSELLSFALTADQVVQLHMTVNPYSATPESMMDWVTRVGNRRAS